MANELVKVLWYYNLLPVGSEKIICPFHVDVNPSMSIDLRNNSWYCFGCNECGDAFKFVNKIENKYNNLNDLQSCIKYHKILKSKKCSEIKFNSGGTGMNRYKKPKKELYDQAYDYYHGLSFIDWRSKDVPQELIETRSYMKDRGFSLNTLNKVKAKVTYNNQYGIIFPMLDNGIFRGWVCRTTHRDIEKKRKYLYNEGFSRATTLVGDYGSEKYVIVVEGYMDRLKFIQYGINNVVAILGWKMTKQQEDKLKAKGITHIISALDNDECGRKGTQYIKTIFNVTRFKYIKGIKDPGEMSKEVFDKCYNKTMLDYNKSSKKERKM